MNRSGIAGDIATQAGIGPDLAQAGNVSDWLPAGRWWHGDAVRINLSIPISGL